jgi:hypothetical protein
VAVTVTGVCEETLPAVAVKVAEVVPAGIKTCVGIVRALEEDAVIDTLAPVLGAGSESVTVNVALFPGSSAPWLVVSD